ncbi:MAG: ABC transporter ATP-binding protein [Trueperaceae bacterium]|nr:ABC transporter ATP-binding protein [Trueperaceae bacterium]
MTLAIETTELSKRYGKKEVVSGVSFKVKPGEVYALVGPNGAGKTTVIRLVTGLAFPTKGKVSLMGLDPHEKPMVRRKLGAVVEAPAAFYPYLSGRENLQLHAKLAGGVSPERITEVLEMMGLSEAQAVKTGVYSLGMRQRLGVAAAMLTKPEVLILDEPASGMDPLSLHLVHSVLQNAAKEGAAVLLSTHHLDEVVAYCSSVGIMEEGRLIDEVDIAARRERYRAKVSDAIKAQQILRYQEFIKQVGTRGDNVVFTLTHPYALSNVVSCLMKQNINVLGLGPDIFNLRAYYQDRLSGNRADAKADSAAVG